MPMVREHMPNNDLISTGLKMMIGPATIEEATLMHILPGMIKHLVQAREAPVMLATAPLTVRVLPPQVFGTTKYDLLSPTALARLLVLLLVGFESVVVGLPLLTVEALLGVSVGVDVVTGRVCMELREATDVVGVVAVCTRACEECCQ